MCTGKHYLIKLIHRVSLRNIISLILPVLLLLLQLHVYGQGKEANIWYFGYKAGIDFNSGSPPTMLLNSQMNAGLGSASIADSTGQLLFYSDGVTIWNKKHVTMQNGDDMGGLTTQGAMIVPQPGSTHLYISLILYGNPIFFNTIFNIL